MKVARESVGAALRERYPWLYQQIQAHRARRSSLAGLTRRLNLLEADVRELRAEVDEERSLAPRVAALVDLVADAAERQIQAVTEPWAEASPPPGVDDSLRSSRLDGGGVEKAADS